MRLVIRWVVIVALVVFYFQLFAAFDGKLSLDESTNFSNQEQNSVKHRGGLLLPDREWWLANIKPWKPAKSGSKGSMDWRNVGGKDYTTDVKDQGYCGSCSAFAALSVLESVMEIENNDSEANYNLSEQHLFSCSGGDCLTGNYQDIVMNELKVNGVPDEDCFSYKSGKWGDDYPCSDSCSDWVERSVRIRDYWYVSSRDMIKTAIDKGPVLAGIEITSGLENYTEGVFAGGDCNGPEYVNHAVALVGYNDAEGYWIAKNSWGKVWGENGFFKIEYGKCGIESWVLKIDYNKNDQPDPLDDDDQDDDSFDGESCPGLIGRLYSECSAIINFNNNNIEESLALDQCENGEEPWDCINACSQHENVTDCLSFFTCLNNRCAVIASSKSDVKNDDDNKSNGGACGG